MRAVVLASRDEQEYVGWIKRSVGAGRKRFWREWIEGPNSAWFLSLAQPL
jgi:hypothetical protein